MALGITAAFTDATGIITLTITGATAAAGAWTLTRTDATGTTSVRVYAALTLTNPRTVVDYECALAGPITYTVTAAAATASVSITPSTARTWLGFPIFPNYNLELALGADFETTFTPTATVHTPLDRDDPVIVDGRFGLSSGRFSILTANEAGAQAVIAAYRRIRLAHLRVGANGKSLYHKVSDLSITPAAARSSQRIVRGTYMEVSRPVGPLVGTMGWTYANTTAASSSYANSQALLPTYADRTAGPPP